MVRFLNEFSKRCQAHTPDQNNYLEKLFNSFLESAEELPNDVFLNKRSRLNIALIESVFSAVCHDSFERCSTVNKFIVKDSIQTLEANDDFKKASLEGTTRRENVEQRLRLGREFVKLV